MSSPLPFTSLCPPPCLFQFLAPILAASKLVFSHTVPHHPPPILWDWSAQSIKLSPSPDSHLSPCSFRKKAEFLSLTENLWPQLALGLGLPQQMTENDLGYSEKCLLRNPQTFSFDLNRKPWYKNKAGGIYLVPWLSCSRSFLLRHHPRKEDLCSLTTSACFVKRWRKTGLVLAKITTPEVCCR